MQNILIAVVAIVAILGGGFLLIGNEPAPQVAVETASDAAPKTMDDAKMADAEKGDMAKADAAMADDMMKKDAMMKDDMAKTDAMKKEEMMKADAMKKEEMMKKEATGDTMAKPDTMVKADTAMAKMGTYEAYAPEKLALAQSGKVVLFFHASWCPSCRALDADITKNLSAIPAGVHILKTDYDTQTELKKKYGITSQNTLVQVDTSGAQIMKWNGEGTLAALVAKAK